MTGLPRETPNGRAGGSPEGAGGPRSARRRAGRMLAGPRERRLLLAAALAAAATLVQVGWQSDQLVSALDAATGDLRVATVSNYVVALWLDLVVIAAAVALIALRRSQRWSPVTWGAALALAVVRALTALPELTARLSMSLPLEPPVWLNSMVLLAGLVSAGLLLAAGPQPE